MNSWQALPLTTRRKGSGGQQSHVGLCSAFFCSLYTQLLNELYSVKEWKPIVEKYFINQIMFKVTFIFFQLSHTALSSIWFHFCHVLSCRDFRKMTVGWLWDAESIFIRNDWFKFDWLKEHHVLFIYMIVTCPVSSSSLGHVPFFWWLKINFWLTRICKEILVTGI